MEMVISPYLSGRSANWYFGEIKVRMVATPYLSGLSIITKW